MFKSMKALFVAALMGGCTATGGWTTPSVASVQQALANACGYELLASTAATDIAALVPAIGVGVATASSIAAAICKAATTTVAPTATIHGGFTKAGAGVLMVQGVPVHGGFK